jgi:hypothetical protein
VIVCRLVERGNAALASLAWVAYLAVHMAMKSLSFSTTRAAAPAARWWRWRALDAAARPSRTT